METQNSMLHGQLQSGLAFELCKAYTVSGAHNYEELCIATKNEDRRLAELEKWQQSEWSRKIVLVKYSARSFIMESNWNTDTKQTSPSYWQPARCYVCNSPTHVAGGEGRTRILKKANIVRSDSQSEAIHQGKVASKKLLESYFYVFKLQLELWLQQLT